jgi:hypothetical protein
MNTDEHRFNRRKLGAGRNLLRFTRIYSDLVEFTRTYSDLVNHGLTPIDTDGETNDNRNPKAEIRSIDRKIDTDGCWILDTRKADPLGWLDPSHCPKPGKTERSLRSYPSRYPPRRWRPVTGKIQTPRPKLQIKSKIQTSKIQTSFKHQGSTPRILDAGAQAESYSDLLRFTQIWSNLVNHGLTPIDTDG